MAFSTMKDTQPLWMSDVIIASGVLLDRHAGSYCSNSGRLISTGACPGKLATIFNSPFMADT